MGGPIEVSGDVSAAASALAGLILVYLGAVIGNFSGFDAPERGAVKARYQWRAWFAFVGLILCLVAVALGLVAKWLGIAGLAVGALFTLLLALVWIGAIAVIAIREMR